MAIKTQVGSFKGNATISLDSDSRYPFSFGLTKAKLILACLPQIQAFVAAHGDGAQAPGVPQAAKQRFQPDRFDMAVEDNGARQCGLIS